MTFTAYIERQKSIIKNRRGAELELCAEAEAEYTDSEKLFKDLSELKGLNVTERLNERRRV